MLLLREETQNRSLLIARGRFRWSFLLDGFGWCFGVALLLDRWLVFARFLWIRLGYYVRFVFGTSVLFDFFDALCVSDKCLELSEWLEIHFDFALLMYPFASSYIRVTVRFALARLGPLPVGGSCFAGGVSVGQIIYSSSSKYK